MVWNNLVPASPIIKFQIPHTFEDCFMRNLFGSILIVFLLSLLTPGQQVPDPDFNPPISQPAYKAPSGPVVLIDEAHFNFHTAGGRYKPFAELLRRDGYVVTPSTSAFTKDSLRIGRVLVIANALSEQNRGNWSLPTPSAFSQSEIAAVREWVMGGGSLLLIVDHMPMPGAAGDLAAAFGIKFSNGYAMDQAGQGGPIIFKRSDGLLRDHAITNGRNAAERVDSVASFTGSAFQIPEGSRPLLVLGQTVSSLLPTVAGQFDQNTPRIPVSGWSQGATLRVGKGRVAVFGEAAMFSAQLAGPDRRPMGMNAPVARQNSQFLLNVLHWLTGLLGD
jgi:hypothetical protein